MSDNGSENMQVLGVVGSPRPNGNTDILIDKVLESAACAGANVSKIYLGKLNIAPCRACQACKKEGRCIVDDDMQGVLDKLDASSIWVLGTPVYWFGPTGWFKAFIDRFYGAYQHIKFKDKSAILVVPMQSTHESTAKHAVGMIECTLNFLKTKLLTSIVVPGVFDRGDVNGHPEILEAAKRAGREAVIDGGCRDTAGCD